MLEEFGLADLDTLGEYIVSTSRESMRAAVRKLPRGTWSAQMDLDGYEAPITLRAALTVSDAGVHVDYAGSSPASRFGINSPKCYTDAYTSFGVKCIVAPGIPNNAGSLEVVTVSCPEDSIVHPLRPRPGHHLQGSSISKCLLEEVPHSIAVVVDELEVDVLLEVEVEVDVDKELVDVLVEVEVVVD